MINIILNPKDAEPNDYTIRKTVKAVILRDDGSILHHFTNLIGGGVEQNENDEEALHREAMEEAGIQIEIIKPLGCVVGYRDSSKRKYVINGYLCKYIKNIGHPTTNDERELKIKLVWESPVEAIRHFEKEIEVIKNTDLSVDGDTYQAKLLNRQMSLEFLKESFK